MLVGSDLRIDFSIAVAQAAIVESVKAVGYVYAPVDGSVVELNVPVTNEPNLINKSPLKDGKGQPYQRITILTSGRCLGWLFKMKISSPNDLKQLKPEKDYLTQYGN